MKTENPYVVGQWNVYTERTTEVWGINKPNEAFARMAYSEMIRHPEAVYTELVDPDGNVLDAVKSFGGRLAEARGRKAD